MQQGEQEGKVGKRKWMLESYVKIMLFFPLVIEAAGSNDARHISPSSAGYRGDSFTPGNVEHTSFTCFLVFKHPFSLSRNKFLEMCF